MEENKGKEYFVLLVESVWRVKRGRKSGIRKSRRKKSEIRLGDSENDSEI
jgi:hypothetical protein